VSAEAAVSSVTVPVSPVTLSIARVVATDTSVPPRVPYVAALGTSVPLTLSSGPCGLSRVPNHVSCGVPRLSCNSFTNTCVGALGAAVPGALSQVLHPASSVPLTILSARPTTTRVAAPVPSVRPSIASVRSTMSSVTVTISSVRVRASRVEILASQKWRVHSAVRSLAHPMRLAPVRSAAGRATCRSSRLIAAERRPITAWPKGEGSVV
jgi:hypothetical protein